MEHTMKGHELTASFRLGSNPHWSIRYLITFVWPLCTALCRQVWPSSLSSNLLSQNRGIRTLTVSRSPLSAATWSVVSKFCNIEAINHLWNIKCNARSRTDMLTAALCHQSALRSIKLFTIWLWLFITAHKRGVAVWYQKQEAERKKVITFTDCKCLRLICTLWHILHLRQLACKIGCHVLLNWYPAYLIHFIYIAFVLVQKQLNHLQLPIMGSHQ